MYVCKFLWIALLFEVKNTHILEGKCVGQPVMTGYRFHRFWTTLKKKKKKDVSETEVCGNPFFCKAKFTLGQAMKSQRGSRGIALLCL